MLNTHNTLAFVQKIMQRLAYAQIIVWLAGGWAEELWSLRSPGPHSDIDLLYPATTFDYFDRWLSQSSNLSEIMEKRFSHKRAFLCEQVMVELILLESRAGGYSTNFFNGSFQLHWPDDALTTLQRGKDMLPVASCHALHLYRQQHHRVAQAFQLYLQRSKTCLD